MVSCRSLAQTDHGILASYSKYCSTNNHMWGGMGGQRVWDSGYKYPWHIQQACDICPTQTEFNKQWVLLQSIPCSPWRVHSQNSVHTWINMCLHMHVLCGRAYVYGHGMGWVCVVYTWEHVSMDVGVQVWLARVCTLPILALATCSRCGSCA